MKKLIASLATLTIIVLIICLVSFNNSSNNELVQEYAKLSEEEQKIHDNVNKITSEYEQWAASRDENIAEVNSEFDYYQSLINELDTIVDKNGNIKNGYEERVKNILDVLSDALGFEYKITYGKIENYNDLF